MMILLSKIDPNPYRDFDIDPLDEEQIEALKASIDDLKFWGGICVRQVGDRYQLAFGHHRLAALRKAGWTKADITVIDYDDLQMARALVKENATQRGRVAVAVDAVGAAVRSLGYFLLTSRQVGIIIPTCLDTEEAIRSAKGLLLKGDGLGRGVIEAFYGGAVSEVDIRTAVKTLKQSGKMAEYLEEIQAKAEEENLRAEREAEAKRAAADAAAERARRAKEEREKEERAEREAREDLERMRAKARAAAKRKEEEAAKRQSARNEKKADSAEAKAKQTRAAKENAEKAAGKMREKEVTFDAKLSRLFTKSSVLEAARAVLTSERGREWIPVDEQYEVCEGLIKYYRDVYEDDRYEPTAKDVTIGLNQYMSDNRRWIKKNRTKREEANDKLVSAVNRLTSGLNAVGNAIAAIEESLAAGAAVDDIQKAVFFRTLPEFIKQMDDFVQKCKLSDSVISNQ